LLPKLGDFLKVGKQHGQTSRQTPKASRLREMAARQLQPLAAMREIYPTPPLGNVHLPEMQGRLHERNSRLH